MIRVDLKKYEGHAPAPWRDTLHDGAKAHRIVDADGKAVCTVHPNRATAELITDTPFLLAEVRRLKAVEKSWFMMWEFLEKYPNQRVHEDLRAHLSEYFGDGAQ